VQFRSLRSTARRVAVAGAASALALTAFNAVQPTLGDRRVHPGTFEDVQVTLTPAAPTGPAGPSGPAGRMAAGPRAKAPASLVSTPVPVGKARFVGFSWPNPAPGTARTEAAGTLWLRTRSASGWSGWREVELAAGGPDANRREYDPGRVYSDGHWLAAGTAEVQVRVDRPVPATTPKAKAGALATGPTARAGAASPPAAARAGLGADPGAGSLADPGVGLRAHLVTPDMTPTPGTEPGRPGQAVAATSQPAIISRARWGADESLRDHAPEYSDTVKAAFVHHTVQSNSYSPSESAALVRADYLYHVRGRGWNDIGYNFLVDRYGRVFEGRYGGVTRAVLGAHAGGFNTNTTGVSLLGTFTSSRPTGPMLAGLQRLLAWKLDLTHVNPRGLTVLTSAGGANTRYPPGRRVVARTILGHRSTSYTDCPGSPTIARLPSIRVAVARIGRPKIYGGAATTSRVSPERGGYAGVHARFSSTVRWRVGVTGSSGAVVRTWRGSGTQAKVRWNGRTASGVPAPPGWATMTVTATAAGVSARPATSRVYVQRTALASGTSTGGFAAGLWSVSNANAEQLSSSSSAFTRLRWGRAGDIAVVGDWDGDGTQTVGVVRPDAGRASNHFLLRNSDGSVADFWYGRDGDRIVVGDWNGDRVWTPGVVRDGRWSLRNANSGGAADVTLRFGRRGDRYLAGDWDGDGDFTPAVQRAGAFWFRNSATTGPSEFNLRFGRPTDLGFVGDWNGNGTWTPGVLRAGARWYLKDSFTGGAAGVGLAKQTPGTPVVGDWDNRP
jgi:N-acetylmuramoyl-L-alanine amidase-like protein